MVGNADNQIETDEHDCMFAIQLTSSSVLPMVLQTVIELNVLEIIAKAGDGAQLSPVDIVSQLPSQNPGAHLMLDRMLRLLANHSVLTCSTVTLDDGRVERRYGLASVCRYFVKNEDGVSFLPWLALFHDNSQMQCWYKLKEAVLEGGNPFYRAHGMNISDYGRRNPQHNQLFSETMFSHTTVIMREILEVYNGFENLKEVVDVGGGVGTMSNILISRYPAIKCINFDLPGVLETAIRQPGIEHVAGDMFVSIPKGETIFMKSILRGRDYEDCLKILRNCYKALPDQGMVILVELILPEGIETNEKGKGTSQLDMIMMTVSKGGKERTKKEFEALAEGAGFDHMKLVCCRCNYGVMEFIK